MKKFFFFFFGISHFNIKIGDNLHFKNNLIVLESKIFREKKKQRVEKRTN